MWHRADCAVRALPFGEKRKTELMLDALLQGEGENLSLLEVLSWPIRKWLVRIQIGVGKNGLIAQAFPRSWDERRASVWVRPGPFLCQTSGSRLGYTFFVEF